VNFTGKNTEGGNLLSWSTANEINNKGFEIERQEGNKWQTLGFVAAQSPKGALSTYEYTDESPLWGLGATAYYRLKQMDNDGKLEYSKVISIQRNIKGRVKIYPSVTNGELTIEGATSFYLINAMGQVVLSNKATPTTTLNLQALPNGIYCVRGKNTEGGDFSEKIVKQ
jgi:hypothetical protein